MTVENLKLIHTEISREELLKHILEIMKENVTDEYEFTYEGDMEDLEKYFPGIEQVHFNGGEYNEEPFVSVVHVPEYNMYIQFSGTYYSFGGTDFDDLFDAKEVFPKSKMITEYVENNENEQ